PDNLQTQHHNHKPKVHRRPRHPLPFRSGPGSAATIGICWRILNGQIIMARIKKTNGNTPLAFTDGLPHKAARFSAPNHLD
ncbi:hypothetical protein, partial [Microbacterium arabinogalactanolyticum]|uniref:hypothetical protein n=1 Tax=Microbacterium arabinogalactanolyticum TaxID=69365 RepID=UPI0031D01E45